VASSSARWRVGCDACGAGGAIGPRAGPGPASRDAWCEACQRGEVVTAAGSPSGCARCGAPLSLEAPRFLEAFGMAQELAAVVAAWGGEPASLRTLLPERPRFLSDLTPPPADAADASRAAAALAELAAGAFAKARPGLVAWTEAAPGEARAWEARAIAEERLGDAAGAEESWSRALACRDAPRARLARGVLRARRGALAEAGADLSRAGEGHEARWNRAALRVVHAVAVTPGLPAGEVLAAARAEAGPVSDYWSDFTVGRLLWTLLVERALARRAAGAPICPEERVLRAAEREFEHDTFWDRAMILHGYASLGMRAEEASVAAPLAAARAGALAAEPFLRARGAEALRDATERAAASVLAGDPAGAGPALDFLLTREDLRRYGVPCAACGRGLLRAEALEDEE